MSERPLLLIVDDDAELPVVIMTASREAGRHPMRGRALLLKPFSLDELLEQVESFVASA